MAERPALVPGHDRGSGRRRCSLTRVLRGEGAPDLERGGRRGPPGPRGAARLGGRIVLAEVSPAMRRAARSGRPRRRGGAVGRTGGRAARGPSSPGRSSSRRSSRLRSRAPGAPRARTRRPGRAGTGRRPGSRWPRSATRREPRHALGPGSTIQRPMLAAPCSHMANGGIDCTASSCSSATRPLDVVALEGVDVALEQLGVGAGRADSAGSSVSTARPSVARARCRALLTAATLVSRSSATSAACQRSTSQRISAARWRAGGAGGR